MRRWPIGLLTFVASLTGALTVEALPIKTLLGDFNVIVQQNLNVSNDIAGPVIVGGNLGPGTGPLNFTNLVLGTTPGTVAIPGYGEVNIFGNQTSPFNTAFGHAFVGGSSGAFPAATSVTLNHAFPPGATPAANPTTFNNEVWMPITAFSALLAGLPANTTPSTFNSTTLTFDLHPDAGIAVVSVNASDLANHPGVLMFNGLPPVPDGLAIINVLGNYTDPSAAYNAGVAQPNVLFNFVNATAVSVLTWGASILAPDALVMGLGGDITGDVVAQNFTTSAETHVNFLDCPAATCTPVNMPEPGSLVLLGVALVSFAGFCCRPLKLIE